MGTRASFVHHIFGGLKPTSPDWIIGLPFPFVVGRSAHVGLLQPLAGPLGQVEPRQDAMSGSLLFEAVAIAARFATKLLAGEQLRRTGSA